MRVIAFYLPQFHRIPENDAWWGPGFTEWTNVRGARPLFDGHRQPRVPAGKRYYDLADPSVWAWQAALAREYGVYGFCCYHYWFKGRLLLEGPLEQMLANRAVDLPFCISWVNEHWTRAWEGKSNRILMRQEYGGRDEWDAHFRYLLPFLRDPRYIKNEGRPLFVIYRPHTLTDLNDRLDRWQQLARQEGLPGIDFAYQQIDLDILGGDDSRFAFNIEYQPNYANHDLFGGRHRRAKAAKRRLAALLDKVGINLEQSRLPGLTKQDYDVTWEAILAHRPTSDKCIPGAFVDWDNTPRKAQRGTVFTGGTPEKFGGYMQRQILRAREVYKKDMLFLFAWNEWAEGGYLEPDEDYGTAWLEALREAVRGCDRA